MRNPKRIKDFMVVLTEIWEHMPDIRFNQLIYNLQREYKDGAYIKKAYVDEIGWGTTEVSYPYLFNVEDDAFMEFLIEKLKELDKN